MIITIGNMTGDTIQWNDVLGPCTGITSRYKISRDSIGLMLDMIGDPCTDRAAAIVNNVFRSRQAAWRFGAVRPFLSSIPYPLVVSSQLLGTNISTTLVCANPA